MKKAKSHTGGLGCPKKKKRFEETLLTLDAWNIKPYDVTREANGTYQL